MTRLPITKELRELVRIRANGLCEYCLISDEDTFIAHEIDHIIAVQHKGLTVESNLAFCCFDCNRAKGPNIASIDPISGDISKLYNPRVDEWDDHFRYEVFTLIGKTSVGRTTIDLLRINSLQRIQQRRAIGF